MKTKKIGRSPFKRSPLRLPGQSDDEKVRSINVDIILYVCFIVFLLFLVFFEWWRWYYKLPPQPLGALVIVLIIITPLGFKIRRLIIERNNWELGRQGEIEVGNYLEGLRSKGYSVFHDIQCKSGDRSFNIDHVLISPNGIFAIETKAPRKLLPKNNYVVFDGKETITISGRRPDKKTISQAISNAKWLSKEILPKRKGYPYLVTPVVVYPDWSVNGPRKTERVWVLNHKLLEWEIVRAPQSLLPEEIESIISVLAEYNRH